MNILIANHALVQPRGSETYVQTVAARLVCLGHRVTCFSEHVGAFAAELRRTGARVVTDAREAEPPDVIHASHLDSAQLAMAAWPLVPMVFVAHGRGTAETLERPPVPVGSIERWVAISEIVGEFMAFRDGVDPAEMTVIPNPIDLERFRPLAALRTPPNRAVFLGPSADPGFRRMVTEAGTLAGLDVRFIGERFGVPDVRGELQRADVAMSIGRGALEAAASGVPVVVIGPLGSDGLLYPDVAKRELAHNYSGLAVRSVPTADELAEELRGANAVLGSWSREWAEEHHDSVRIVGELVEVYEQAVERAKGRLAQEGATALLEARYRELYPALRWWHRLPMAMELRADRSPLGWIDPHMDEDREGDIQRVRQRYEHVLGGMEDEARYWRTRYERVVSNPLVSLAIRLRDGVRRRSTAARD